MSKYTEHREKAAEIQTRLMNNVAAIRGNSNLSTEGRNRLLAKAYARTKSEVDALAKAERELLTTSRAKLERDLFALPAGAGGSDAISMRDAADRATSLVSEGEALRLLTRAEQSGDVVLAQAVARVAADNDWSDCFNAWAQPKTQHHDRINQLSEIDSMITGPRASMITGAAYHVPLPTELQRLGSGEVAQLAGEPEPAVNWSPFSSSPPSAAIPVQ